MVLMKKLLLSALLFCPLLALADGLPTGPYIYVVGHGEASAPADRASVSFNLTATDTDQSQAKEAVNARSEAVFKLVDQLGIDRDDFQAYAISSEPQYSYNSSGRKPDFLGYKVTRSFSVTLRDLAKYHALIDGLFNLKVDSLRGATAYSSKARELLAAAADQALQNARAQAEIIAKQSGMRLKGVFAVSPVSFPTILNDLFQTGDAHYGGMAFGMSRAAAPENTLYSFPPVKVASTIHVIYLLEPAPKTNG